MININIFFFGFLRFLLLCLSGFCGVMLFTIPLIAQERIDEHIKEESIKNWRFGVYFSGSGIIKDLDESLLIGGITHPDQDIIPYPTLFLTMRYNKFQILSGWARDGKSHIHSSTAGVNAHNEHIFIFAARYNYYPLKKIIYIYGGPAFYYFNKELLFQHVEPEICSDYCKTIIYNKNYYKTDRPNGKSIWFGISSGLGVEYKLLGLIWSHEIEVYFTPCKYEDFICAGGDIKFWGIHFPF